LRRPLNGAPNKMTPIEGESCEEWRGFFFGYIGQERD